MAHNVATRLFVVAGPNCWNESPAELRDLTVGPINFYKTLKDALVFF